MKARGERIVLIRLPSGPIFADPFATRHVDAQI
jgi:hypothetical protein